MSEAALKVMERVQAADRSGALSLAADYLAKGERHPLILMLVAEQLEERGQLRQAIALLEEALPQAQEEPELWRRYGVALGRQGLHGPARQALERALSLSPQQPAIPMALGTVCYQQGDLVTAATHLEAAMKLAPQWVEPRAALAAIAVQSGRAEEGQRLARQALTIDPSNVTAQVALARSLLDSGRPADAEALASALLGKLPPRHEHRLSLLGLRADARDAQGRYADAFQDYSSRNALLTAHHTPFVAASGQERRFEEARRLKAWFDATDPEHWIATDERRAAMTPRCAEHLFVVGFPRSGTTLLEKALAGHSAIRTLPEVDCLGQAGLDMLANDEGLSSLAALPVDEIERLRTRYFDAVTQATGDISGKVIVDKLPLHSINLPLIAKLFPHARIVLSLRDPRDVVLSGFRRRFQMNMAMFELLTLTGAAQYYDAVMALVERYRTVLPIEPIEVRHEDLVEDFEAQVTRVLALAGLDWEESIRDFAGRAAANPRTPSDIQLKRGLNRDGVGSWRRYESQIRPVMPVLDRWIERWGYSTG